MGKKLRILSMILFGIALFLPTHCTNVECSDFGSGLELLLSGWILAFFNSGAFAWLANPLYFIAFRYSKKDPGVSMWFAVAATIIACTFLSGGELLLNEAGHMAYITKIQIGYWFWFGSIIVLLVASGFEIMERKKKAVVKL
jgi:hypothetical protein